MDAEVNAESFKSQSEASKTTHQTGKNFNFSYFHHVLHVPLYILFLIRVSTVSPARLIVQYDGYNALYSYGVFARTVLVRVMLCSIRTFVFCFPFFYMSCDTFVFDRLEHLYLTYIGKMVLEVSCVQSLYVESHIYSR